MAVLRMGTSITIVQNAPLRGRLRNERQQKIRFFVEEKKRIWGVSGNPWNWKLGHQAYILAINWKTNSGYIFDPTICLKYKKPQHFMTKQHSQ